MLLTTGFDYREHGLDKAAAGRTLGAEGKFTPDDRVTQRPLACIVRRFYAFATNERL